MLIPTRAKNNRRNIVIVGDTAVITEFGRFLQKRRPRYRINSVLYFAGRENLPDIRELPASSASVDSVGELLNYIEKNSVDELFVLVSEGNYTALHRELVDSCLEMGIVCHIPVSTKGYENHQHTILDWQALSLRTLFSGSLYKNPFLRIKYCFDFCLSLLLVLLFSPVFLVIAILIIISSGWPVFFVHKRVGYNRRIFNMIKFRTMVKNAEAMQADLESRNEADGAAFKIADDPRITRFGKWLRKMSLDELPQLFNVIKGEMSLVGPRPLPVRDVGRIEHRRQYRRFSALPGMTCTWQTSRRYDIPFDEWVRLDLEYIDNWSFGKDLKILYQTIPAVLLGKGR